MKRYLILCCFFIFYLPAKAQKLSEKEKKIIQYEAEMFIKEYQLLLNTIISTSLNRLEVEELIQNSYTQTGNRIFLNHNVIIEDDIDPNYYSSAKVKDVKVSKYLNDLDLFYSKSATTHSITFSDMLSSEVKEKDYIYVEVYFKSEFLGRHITINTPYKSTERIATIIAKKNLREDIWEMTIASIVFYDPVKHPHVIQKKEEQKQAEIAKKDSLLINSQNNAKIKNSSINSKPVNNSKSLKTQTGGLSKTPLQVSFGVAAFSLSSSAYFLIKANNNYKSWEETPIGEEKDNFETLTKRHDLLSAVSGIACGGALVYYYLYRKKYLSSKKNSITFNIYQPTLNTYGISIAKKF